MVTMNYGKTYECLEVFLKKYALCLGGVFKACQDQDCKNNKNVINWRKTLYYYCEDISLSCPENLTLKESENSYVYECTSDKCPASMGFVWKFQERSELSYEKWICSDSKNTCERITKDEDGNYYCEASPAVDCVEKKLIPTKSCQEEDCIEVYPEWHCHLNKSNSTLFLLIGCMLPFIMIGTWIALKCCQKKRLENELARDSSQSASLMIK